MFSARTTVIIMSEYEQLPPNDEDFESMLEASFRDYNLPRRGEIRTAIILQIEEREIIVDLGAKQDGIVPYTDIERMDDEFKETLTVGEEVPVYVLNPSDSNNNLIVSINMGLQRYDWEKARGLLNGEEAVDVTVTGYNKGGLLVRWRRLEGFIPSSHLTSADLTLERREAMAALMNTKLGVKVIEVDQDRRRLIFSEREAQREWRIRQKARLLEELKEGDVVNGTVTGLRDFGAFVNIGGADGLIHVSELAWHRVDHPRDILGIGDKIEVYILNLDRDTNRIALSLKRLLSDPWDDAQLRYHEGQLTEGTVTNVVDFGAFVALDDGLEGLLHLSEMGDGSLKEPYSYVQKNDRLTLRISHLEPEKRRVGFTQRWGTEDEDLVISSTADGDTSAKETSDEAVSESDEPVETSDEPVSESDESVEASDNAVSESSEPAEASDE
ncbi:MAG: S1 RNA-binding domain-containing protein [Anaerolineae bacterium]|nr:S1 RNA-binding domain-containing protein [Anaerolineae bacterium]